MDTTIIYFIIFSSMMIVLYSEEKNDAIISFLTCKKKGDTVIMENLLQQLIGKDCIIRTLKGDFQGKLLTVDATSLVLERNNLSEFVNLEYVISAKQIPLNKKGKKKDILYIE